MTLWESSAVLSQYSLHSNYRHGEWALFNFIVLGGLYLNAALQTLELCMKMHRWTSTLFSPGGWNTFFSSLSWLMLWALFFVLSCLCTRVFALFSTSWLALALTDFRLRLGSCRDQSRLMSGCTSCKSMQCSNVAVETFVCVCECVPRLQKLNDCVRSHCEVRFSAAASRHVFYTVLLLLVLSASSCQWANVCHRLTHSDTHTMCFVRLFWTPGRQIYLCICICNRVTWFPSSFFYPFVFNFKWRKHCLGEKKHVFTFNSFQPWLLFGKIPK